MHPPLTYHKSATCILATALALSRIHPVWLDPSQHGISGAFILQNHSSVVWGILTCLKQDAVLSVIHLT